MTEVLLHVYGQMQPTDDVVIVGNRAGLLVLKNAIDRALRSKKGTSKTKAMVSDGNQNNIRLVINDNDLHSDSWQKYRLPYSY